jgi:hypothetical protein
MTMPITDPEYIRYLLEQCDPDATKEVLQEIYPEWDI